MDDNFTCLACPDIQCNLCYIILRDIKRDNPMALSTVLIFILNCFFWNINMEKLCGNAKLATEKVHFTAVVKNNKK